MTEIKPGLFVDLKETDLKIIQYDYDNSHIIELDYGTFCELANVVGKRIREILNYPEDHETPPPK